MTDTTGVQKIVPAAAGIYEPLMPYAYPLVRIVAGGFLAPHGYPKLFVAGRAEQTAGFFSKVGLEPALQLVYLVGVTEFVGGILIALGLLTRPAAIGAAILLAVAAFKVHLANGFFWTTGGLEYPLMWCLIMVAIAIKGGGAYSIDRRIGKEF
ncbi:MAG: DoxX family protein [Alphaproteobacteria bacterium]|nr:DoxX family protein [Alphaproteobacteria bacterium]